MPTSIIEDIITIIIETDSEEKILEELKKIDIEITDKRRYGRARYNNNNNRNRNSYKPHYKNK